MPRSREEAFVRRDEALNNLEDRREAESDRRSLFYTLCRRKQVSLLFLRKTAWESAQVSDAGDRTLGISRETAMDPPE